MTSRAAWTGAPPDPIWWFWDQYDIKDKTMIGYWDPNNPVTVNNDSIKVTVYQGVKETILAVANFGSLDQERFLKINFCALGYDADKCSIIIPKIERYQDRQQLPSLDHFKIPGKRGYLMILENG